MESFVSTVVMKVDRKGRVSVPATFRSALSSQRFNGVVVVPSFKFQALEGMSGDYVEEMTESLQLVDQYSEEYENLSLFFAEAQRLPFDGEGRIVLSDSLKEHAKIDSEAAFVGRGPTFEIWEPARFDEHRATIRERFRSQGQTWPARGALRRPQ